MPSDPTKPLIRLGVRGRRDRDPGTPRPVPRPEASPQAAQVRAFGPKFNRLRQLLDRNSDSLELRRDATALAPERLLVFEVRGPIETFAAAIRRVRGLELIDEEELGSDDTDRNPVAYLVVPDMQALHELESLWRRWQSGELRRGETPWREVFEHLRDLRPWGPRDRVSKLEADFLRDEIEGLHDEELVRLEIELVFRVNERAVSVHIEEVQSTVNATGGRVVSMSRIQDIAYHALLIDLPVREVRGLLEAHGGSISTLESVMHIRPQSTAPEIELTDVVERRPIRRSEVVGDPILALLDGVPVAAHPLLRNHLIVDDQFSLEPSAPVNQRVHGTAMASLVVHGDLNRQEPPLPRRIHLIPVLGAGDGFPRDRLVVDVVYTAVLAMREGTEPTAPNVLIVNLSLGNVRRPFHGQLSPWSRLLDRLSYRLGILFVVSAGNHAARIGIPGFATSIDYEDATAQARAKGTVSAVGRVVGERRIIAPAETVNGITIGAANEDTIAPAARAVARGIIDPYSTMRMANPSSAVGPGFAQAVKPDILMPGAREHVRVVRNHQYIDVAPANPGRYAGLRVAAPPTGGIENGSAYTCGTSAATALASRTAHLIHDALEATYGDDFVQLPLLERAVLLKALLAHPARWPIEAADLIKEALGPPDARQHVRQKDNIRRFLGYGLVDADDAVACTADRATFWATGSINSETVVSVTVPIPAALGGKRRPHSLATTLAWFTPILPARKSYRAVRLRLLEPNRLEDLRVIPGRAHRYEPISTRHAVLASLGRRQGSHSGREYDHSTRDPTRARHRHAHRRTGSVWTCNYISNARTNRAV